MQNELRSNIILCGVGGQGTILASRLLADAAMKRGAEVKTAETIGMAQRGGSVFSHMRIGRDLHSPLIGPGCADLIIGFEPAEVIRHLPYLKEDGRAVVSDRPVMPVSAMIGAAPYPAEEVLAYLKANVKHLTLVDAARAAKELGSTLVDAARAAKELGSAKVLNVVLLGAALRSGALDLTEEELLAAVYARVPERFRALNEAALRFS